MNIRNFVSWQFYKLYKFTKLEEEHFQPSCKDIFLVSYPRSGNTWMRVLLTELIYDKVIESLADVEKYIPDIHFNPIKKDVVESEFHVVKSHDPNNPRFKSSNYKKVIYLIRDPRDVVLSHYRYSVGRGYDNDFDHFLLDWVNGRIWPTSWQEHVNSWVGSKDADERSNMIVIKYEDLKSNTVENIKIITNFIGLIINEEDILLAISNSSLSNMKEKEEQGLRKGEDNEKMLFIGNGKSGDWKNFLSMPQVDLIQKYSYLPMKKFNYL